MGQMISADFHVGDIVELKEDMYSDMYSKTFYQGHHFKVKGIEKNGLVVEDEDGYLIAKEGFLRFEVHLPRGDYRENHSSGWYSYRHS